MNSWRAAVHVVWPIEVKLGIRCLLNFMRCTEIGAWKAVRLLLASVKLHSRVYREAV